MQLHLNDLQTRELHTLLTAALGDLSSEIADTDNPAFKRELRDRRLQLQEILQEIDAAKIP